MTRSWSEAGLREAVQRLVEVTYSPFPPQAQQETVSVFRQPGAKEMLLDAIDELTEYRRQQRCVETTEQALKRLAQYYAGRAAAAQRVGEQQPMDEGWKLHHEFGGLYWKIRLETIEKIARDLEIKLSSYETLLPDYYPDRK